MFCICVNSIEDIDEKGAKEEKLGITKAQSIHILMKMKLFSNSNSHFMCIHIVYIYESIYLSVYLYVYGLAVVSKYSGTRGLRSICLNERQI